MKGMKYWCLLCYRQKDRKIEEKMKLCLQRVGRAEKELSQVSNTFLWGNIKIISKFVNKPLCQ